MSYNEQDYPEPHKFMPERYLKNGKLTDNIVVAIAATNTGGPAGFIVAVAFNAYCYGCSSSLVRVTDGTPDGTWKFCLTLPVPASFE